MPTRSSFRPHKATPRQQLYGQRSDDNIGLTSDIHKQRDRSPLPLQQRSMSDTFFCQRQFANMANPLNYHSSKKTLSVDSPSFTPIVLANTNAGGNVVQSLASRAINAAPFTPRSATSGTATPSLSVDESTGLDPSQIKEFTPHNYDATSMSGNMLDIHSAYDPFIVQHSAVPTQYNPYLEDNASLSQSSNAFYPSQTAYVSPAQPLQHHLYAPVGPHREDLLAYQRTAHDFFMQEKHREELQKKSDATLQTMPNSQLPQLDPYHSLVALDTNHHKNTAIFGYPTWVYKAQSSRNGKFYCLRRIEGYRLTNEKAIKAVKEWKRVDSATVVSVVEEFTTRAFGDSSIIFVYDYFPLSKTLVEQHFAAINRYSGRSTSIVPEQVLWSYVVQLAAALKTVHALKLAVRCMDPSKVIVTDKNRVRFAACGLLDVLHFEAQRSLTDLQQEDFQLLGKLMLQLAANTLTPNHAAIDQIGRLYSAELRDTITWLLRAPQPGSPTKIDDLLQRISSQVITTLETSLHAQDTITSELYRELENGRIARLMMKLGTINERADMDGNHDWAETGDRYMLKLFRDYVFHQVDSSGRPVVEMGHIITCLNKLDAGIEEKIMLTSRDDQNCFVISYKELKKATANAFGELTKTKQGGRGF